jgi:UDPglucose 6-dehydrogenase
MTIAVIGTGYVGLVSAACFAELGHTVWGIDIDAAKVQMLRAGKSPIFEPGLEELIKQGLENGRLRFETDITLALPHVQICAPCLQWQKLLHTKWIIRLCL